MSFLNNALIEEIKNDSEQIINYICYVNEIDKATWVKKKLNGVELISIDTLQPQEALKSIFICNFFFDFENTTLFTNHDNLTKYENINFKFIPPINREEYSDLCFNLIDHVKSNHVLIVQHDSFITNPKLWNDNFLSYDYIGAPFNACLTNLIKKQIAIEHKNRVGNGGFSLRSKKFIKFSNLIYDLPRFRNEEDLIFTYQYFELAEKLNVRFAPYELALQFSFEFDENDKTVVVNDTYNMIEHFGFHHVINKNKILEDIEIWKQNNKFFQNTNKKSNLLTNDTNNNNEAYFSLHKISIDNNLVLNQNLNFYINAQKISVAGLHDSKLFLEDLQFIFIVKIDSDERLSNLQTVIRHLNNNFINKIIIYEVGEYSKISFDGNYDKILIKGIFNKNLIANSVYENSKSDLIFNCESDVIFDPRSIKEAYDILKSGKFNFAIPHNGFAIWMNSNKTLNFKNDFILPEIWKHFYGLEKSLDNKQDQQQLLKHPGFGYMFKKSFFQNNGYENIKFEKHGFEDYERIIRIQKLGHEVFWSSGFAYHLWHPKNKNNLFYEYDDKNLKELKKIINMSKSELLNKIKNGEK